MAVVITHIPEKKEEEKLAYHMVCDCGGRFMCEETDFSRTKGIPMMYIIECPICHRENRYRSDTVKNSRIRYEEYEAALQRQREMTGRCM